MLTLPSPVCRGMKPLEWHVHTSIYEKRLYHSLSTLHIRVYGDVMFYRISRDEINISPFSLKRSFFIKSFAMS